MSVGLLAGLMFVNTTAAQTASIQDCLGAIPICQQVYQGDQIPLGNGNVTDFETDDTCLPFEIYSIWYTFTVDNSGQFGFILTPDDPAQDFDWVLFNITDVSCGELSGNPSLVVSCNAAGDVGCNGATGATGGTNFNNQGPDCGNNPPNQNEGFSPFNDLIEVEAGNTYALCISNFSVTSQGYTLDFGLSSDIGIFDETPPNLLSVSYTDSCNGREMVALFSEYIQLSTIDADNFRIDGPGGPYTVEMSSVNGDEGGNYSKEFLLTVSPPIPGGITFSMDLVVDGMTEALDLCGNPSSYAIMELVQPMASEAVDLGPDTTFCAGNSLTLSSNVQGTYNWSDGSTANSISVSASGTYWLSVATICGTISDTIDVSVIDANLPADILGKDTTLCNSAAYLLDATTPGSTYLWQDGSTGPTLSVDQPGTYSITVNNECGSRSDSVTVTYLESLQTGLPIDTVLCPGERLSLDVSDPNATDYTWQDGTTGPVYNIEAPGAYSIVVENPCESVTQAINVSPCSTCDIYIPNVFSPNGDGVNDKFHPYSSCPLENYSLRVFNRWGNLIYESKNAEDAWEGDINGKPVDIGVYIYSLEANVVEDGSARGINLFGEVTIAR